MSLRNGEDAALIHKTRRMIYNYVHAHPGVSSKKIRKIFDLNKSTLRYHMDYLEKAEKVRSELYGNKGKRYFCKERATFNLDPLTGIDMDSLSTTKQRLITLIRRSPGITRKELLQNLNIDRKTLSSNLKKLSEDKIIIKVDDGYQYVTKQMLKDMIYKRLLMRLLSDEIDEEMFLAVKQKLEMLDNDESDDERF